MLSLPMCAATPVRASAQPKAEPIRAGVDCDPARTKNSDGSVKSAPAGPASRPGETLVLQYDDFGPQASAGQLLGPRWWAWEGGGSWEQCDAFDVRVVVYRGLSRDVVEKLYPTAKSNADLAQRADFRYVEYAEALAHLDRELATLDGLEEGDHGLAHMRAGLVKTRGRIVAALGPAK